MRYPVLIEKGTDTTAFGVVVPDLPGYGNSAAWGHALGIPSLSWVLPFMSASVSYHIASWAEAGWCCWPTPPARGRHGRADEPAGRAEPTSRGAGPPAVVGLAGSSAR